MKRIVSLLVLVMTAVGAFAVHAQSTGQKPATTKTVISLSDARSRIDKAIETPAVMTEIMQSLSAEDQKQFLADVNKAISDMPASTEEKSAKFLSVNYAAIKGAEKGNVATLIAEVYATVPVEALTIINERFAIDLFGRTSEEGSSFTDAQFTEIAKAVMEKVNERCEETDNGSPRSALAIVMLLRASNGTPADLSETLIETLKHDDAKEMARNEWVPAALGKDDRQQSYESILASADAGRRPDYDFVLVIAGPQYGDSVLHDIFGKNNDPLSQINTRSPVLDAVENPLVHQIPIVGGDLAGRADTQPQKGADVVVNPDGTIVPDVPEPTPYSGQTTY